MIDKKQNPMMATVDTYKIFANMRFMRRSDIAAILLGYDPAFIDYMNTSDHPSNYVNFLTLLRREKLKDIRKTPKNVVLWADARGIEVPSDFRTAVNEIKIDHDALSQIGKLNDNEGQSDNYSEIKFPTSTMMKVMYFMISEHYEFDPTKKSTIKMQKEKIRDLINDRMPHHVDPCDPKTIQYYIDYADYLYGSGSENYRAWPARKFPIKKK